LLRKLLYVRNRDSVYFQKGQLVGSFLFGLGGGLALLYYPCARLVCFTFLRVIRSEDGQWIFEPCRPALVYRDETCPY